MPEASSLQLLLDLRDGTLVGLEADAIVSLADSPGVETIAEGIETEHQEETARELGVQLGQGFRCAKPRPVEELDDALRSAAETLRHLQEG